MRDLYRQLKSKFNLPDYDKLNHIFEISTIEDDEFAIREIRNKISDKVEKYVKILDELIHGEGSFGSLHEMRNMGEELRDAIFKLYSDFMMISRHSLELSLVEDDNMNAEFINDIFSRWDDLMSRMKQVVSVMKDAWKDEVKLKEQLEYLG